MLSFVLSIDLRLMKRYVFFISKMPEREDDHLTPATRLLEKRREMSEVEQALAAQKEVGNRRRSAVKLIIVKKFKFVK